MSEAASMAWATANRGGPCWPLKTENLVDDFMVAYDAEMKSYIVYVMSCLPC